LEHAASVREGAVHDCVEIRFDSEIIAIEITKWLFKRFFENLSHCSEEKAQLEDLVLRSLNLLSEIDRQYQLAVICVDEDEEAKRREDVLFRLRVRVLVNLLGLSVYDRDRDFDRTLQVDLLRRAEEMKRVFAERYASKHRRAFSASGGSGEGPRSNGRTACFLFRDFSLRSW
jgi:hypothetical protein